MYSVDEARKMKNFASESSFLKFIYTLVGSSKMKISILLLLATLASAEFEGLLNSMPADALAGLMTEGGKETMSGMDSFKSGPVVYKKIVPYSPSLKVPVAKKVLKAAAVAPLKK